MRECSINSESIGEEIKQTMFYYLAPIVAKEGYSRKVSHLDFKV
jgi:hypothetical protein